MEDTFLWMLIFAGATIGLLAIFLISSERELKKKRGQIDQLLAKLESATIPASEHEGGDSLATAEPDPRQGDMSTLSSKLETSEAVTEELSRMQERLTAIEDERIQLRLVNEQLQRETADLELQLENSRAHIAASDNPESNSEERAVQLLEEITQLKDKLEHSQSEVQRLANAHEQLADARARELSAAEQQRRLERERTDLETELAAKRAELDNAGSRIQDAETIHQNLRDENQRLQDDLSACRERLAEIEGEQLCLRTARQQLDEIRGKHAECCAAHQSVEKGLSALGLLLEQSASNKAGVNGSDDAQACPRPDDETAGGNGACVDGAGSSNLPGNQSSPVKRRRFGLFTS